MPLTTFLHRAVTVLCTVLLFWACPSGLAQNISTEQTNAQPSGQADVDIDLEIRIVQALDQPVSLQVQNIPIREAIKKLAQNADIPIEIQVGTLKLLPYGHKTELTTSFEERPLRIGLTALLRPLGLEFEPTAKALLIRPTPPLARLVRRATWQELETLQKLYSNPWNRQLFEETEFQFRDTAISDLKNNREVLYQLIEQVGEGSAAEVLEIACNQAGWTWFPSDGRVVILPQIEQIERWLEKRIISLKYEQAGLKEVLYDLAQKAGVELHLDPGVLQSLPPQAGERFLLSIQNSTIRQVLELIAGETGIGYVIESDGIRVTSSTSVEAPRSRARSTTEQPETNDIARRTVAALRSNSIIGQVTFTAEDGTTFSFFLRENDLPPEVNALRKKRIHDAAIDIGKALRAKEPMD